MLQKLPYIKFRFNMPRFTEVSSSSSLHGLNARLLLIASESSCWTLSLSR